MKENKTENEINVNQDIEIRQKIEKDFKMN